jgi:hypothetical protein
VKRGGPQPLRAQFSQPARFSCALHLLNAVEITNPFYNDRHFCQQSGTAKFATNHSAMKNLLRPPCLAPERNQIDRHLPERAL